MEQESAQPWMVQDRPETVRTMLSEVERHKALKENRERYRIIGSLLAGKETDITGDPQIFGALNKERIAVEDYMKLFPEHIKDSLEEVARIKSQPGFNGKDYNPKSLAKWRMPGVMPRCVGELYMEVYEGDRKSMYAAFKRFFNEFPAFRISDSRI